MPTQPDTQEFDSGELVDAAKLRNTGLRTGDPETISAAETRALNVHAKTGINLSFIAKLLHMDRKPTPDET